MSMDVVDVSEGYVEVVIQRTVRVGQTLRINPSEAYLGIESGVIEVAGLVPWNIDPEIVYINAIDAGDIYRFMEEFHRVEIDNMGHSPTELAKMIYEHRNTPWVLYTYSYKDEWGILPLQEFVDHTMQY